MTDGCDISREIVLRWTSLDFSDDKSTLVPVMDWCRQATSHNLNQYWPRSLPPYGFTRPQWVKLIHGRMSVVYHDWPGVLFIKPILVLCMQFSSLSLNWRRSHIYRNCSQMLKNLSPLKSCRLLLQLTCIFSQVVGIFHVVYCDD